MGDLQYLPVWERGSFESGCGADGFAGGSVFGWILEEAEPDWKPASFGGGSTVATATFCGTAVGVGKMGVSASPRHRLATAGWPETASLVTGEG